MYTATKIYNIIQASAVVKFTNTYLIIYAIHLHRMSHFAADSQFLLAAKIGRKGDKIKFEILHDLKSLTLIL